MLAAIRKNRFGIIVFFILFCLSVVFIKQKQRENKERLKEYENTKNTVPPELFESIKNLKGKLLSLEFDNNVRTQELLTLRRKLKDKFNENMTEGHSLSLPSIYNSLPHLLGHKDALTPHTHLTSHRKGVTLAFGIPTVRRQQKSYLIQTLSSMITGLNEEEKKDILIIVFIGEQNEEYINEIVNSIKKDFQSSIDSGLLEVIAPPRNYYPALDNLPSTFNDPKERVKWRAKQNLDYAFLMMYAQSRAIFYVQMEDDLIATPSYASTIKSFAMQQSSNKWFILEFSSLGFIGKLFHAYDLSILIDFFLIFYKDKPNDWLLDHVLWVKVCNPEKDAKHCNREKHKLRIKFKPSLFQHVGKQSSLKGKTQKLIDKDFKKEALFQAHLNPKASIKTNFEEYQTYTALRGYMGHTFLWALTPVKNAVIRIIFDEAHLITKCYFKTGNVEHPGDILVNATIEALTLEKKIIRDQSSSKASEDDPSAPYLPEDYTHLGDFNPSGVADITVSSSMGEVSELRLRILHDVKDNWVIISEFNVNVVKVHKP